MASQSPSSSSGTLYLVATHLGNPADMTYRARNILKQVDLIVGEELKEAARLLKILDIRTELCQLNEHNEAADADRIISYLERGEDVALVSDTGTPVLADPGGVLVKYALEHDIRVIAIPGPCSPLAALVASGFPTFKWYYRGFLSPKKELRRKQIRELSKEPHTTIIMETPYRLHTLLADLQEQLSKQRQIALCWQLTLPDEEIIRGNSTEVLESAKGKNWQKGEFVVIIEGAVQAPLGNLSTI